MSRGGFMLDKTNLYSASEIESALISKMLFEVYDALKERGYNPINQLLGYLVSGDPGYISSYKNARNKITKYDRTKILMAILEGYLEQ
jgi:uncharacterized protein (UPF0297 family)